jgi:hypothetical protein
MMSSRDVAIGSYVDIFARATVVYMLYYKNAYEMPFRGVLSYLLRNDGPAFRRLHVPLLP